MGFRGVVVGDLAVVRQGLAAEGGVVIVVFFVGFGDLLITVGRWDEFGSVAFQFVRVFDTVCTVRTAMGLGTDNLLW